MLIAASDDQLMRKIAKGDSRAFRELFDRHGSKVMGYAMRILGGQKEAAEEITQQVWIKVAEKASSYRAQNQFIAWVFTITRNQALKEIKRNQKFENETEIDKAVLEGSAQSVEEELLDLGHQLEIKKAIDALPAQQRVALLLWLTEELSYEKIATELGVSVSSVKSLLFRARKTLRERLGSHE